MVKNNKNKKNKKRRKRQKKNSTVVKKIINIRGGKNQFRGGKNSRKLLCPLRVHSFDWLAICGKTCLVGSGTWKMARTYLISRVQRHSRGSSYLIG